MSAVQPVQPTRSTPKKVQDQMTQADQQRLFEALDLLQKQRAEEDLRTNTVLDASAREEQMVESLRQLRQARGELVNEEELRAAVRSTREPTNLVYRRKQNGLGHSFARVYLARAKWFPHTMVGLSVVAMLWGGMAWRTHAIEKSFQETVASSTLALSEMQGRRLAFDGVAAKWPQGPGQIVHRASFDRALAQSDEALRAAQAGLAAPTVETVDSVAPLIGQSASALSAARAAQVDALAQVEMATRARQVAAQPEDVSWPEVNVRRRARLAELEGAIASGALAQSRDALSALATLSNASALRATLREAAGLVPPAGQVEAQAMRTRGEAALLNADVQSANAALSSLRSLTDVIATSYTMKIVNEDGVKSGVWRYPNDNPNARNYYVVVDALDASGNPVSVPVVNEESGKTETVSRFAVRVTESVYEGVKSDKMDNGLIDNAIVGAKQSGKIKPEYNIDTAGGGIITKW